MDIKTISKITKWMGSTDLSEVSWRKGPDGFELKFAGADTASFMPESSLIPLPSPAVGIYRFSPPGKSGNIKEGMLVKTDQKLGYVEMSGEQKPVVSPMEGFLRILCVEEGKSVQYGQPLFFIEPR